MDIQRLIWDATNRAKLRAHDIEASEVDSMLAADEWVPTSHPEYLDQVRIIGPTLTGRWLTIALEQTNDLRIWRPVTDWPSTRAEMAYYWEEMR